MKKVVLFGASGKTGKYIIKRLQSLNDIQLTAFVRTPSKLDCMDLKNVKIIQGDALNPKDVYKAMEGQDILIGSLEGDVLSMANNIVSSLQKTSVKRIIWITGMGIHHEIKGVRGKMLGILAKMRPDYIKAADNIAASKAVTTLLRCPQINDGDNEKYYLTKEGEQPSSKDIDRAGIAKCIEDMILNDSLGVNDSLGITN